MPKPTLSLTQQAKKCFSDSSAWSRHLLTAALMIICLDATAVTENIATNESTPKGDPSNAFDHSHTLWNEVLTQYVHTQNGISRVNYSALKPQAEPLYHYLKQLEGVTENSFQQFSRDQQLAFLLNYYNAHQVQQIIENYPLKSVRDLGFLIFTPWQKEFFTIFGKPAHLDFIGHDLLEPYKEPRIHFALNCASIGCPALQNRAYQADKLIQQLNMAAKHFLNNKALNSYNPNKHQLLLSPIFKWYAQDFGTKAQLQTFVARYMDGFKFQDKLADINYSDYDWNLNDTKSGF